MEGRPGGGVGGAAAASGRRGRLLALKAAVSVGLLAVLLWQVDRGRMLGALRGAALPLLAACVPLYLLGQLLSTWRWALLLRTEGIDAPLWRLYLLYLEGMFFSLFLPTAVGGDVVRGYRIWHLTRAGEGALASILVERITGFVAMIGIAGAATATAFGTGALRDPPVVAFVAAVAAALAGGAVLVSSPSAFALVERWAAGRAPAGPLQAARRFVEAVHRYRGRGRAVGAALGISVAFQTLLIFMVFLVAVALRLPVRFLQFLVFIPVVNVVAMVPVTISGLGVREGGTVYLLAKVGVDPAGALALSLLWFATVAVASLPGGIVFLWGGHAAKARVVSPGAPVPGPWAPVPDPSSRVPGQGWNCDVGEPEGKGTPGRSGQPDPDGSG